ncbi:DUF2155 domain-containing protein [Rhodovibrionaceae bacterium A322]
MRLSLRHPPVFAGLSATALFLLSTLASGALEAQETQNSFTAPSILSESDSDRQEGQQELVPALLSPQDSLGDPKDIAVLQGLDKITARISTFEAPLNQAIDFGSLSIVARACYKTPPVEPPESAAFLEVDDVRPDRPRQALFTGWMYASSPAISSLEHPVYDVWVIDCRPVITEEADSAQADSKN